MPLNYLIKDITKLMKRKMKNNFFIFFFVQQDLLIRWLSHRSNIQFVTFFSFSVLNVFFSFFILFCFVCVCVCHLNHKRKVGNPLKFQRNSPRPIKNLPICFIFLRKITFGELFGPVQSEWQIPELVEFKSRNTKFELTSTKWM